MAPPVLTKPQQMVLYELRRSGPLPIRPVGYYKRNACLPRMAVAKTKLIECFTGKDGSTWIRLTKVGQEFLAAISDMDGVR